MKKHLTYLSLLIIITTLYSCGPRLNGKSDKEFNESKKKVEEKLNKKERTTLEIALRVTVLEAMRLKWEESDKYKDQSFNTISLKLVDGKTYSSTVSQAEGFLKADNDRNMATLTKEIDSLEKTRTENVEAKKKMQSLFKLSPLELVKEDFFDKKVPQLKIDYEYTGKQPLKGEVDVTIELFKTGAKDAIVSHTVGRGEANSLLQTGDSLTDNLILDDLAQKEPEKWNALKYPVENPDLKSLGLRLEVYPSQFTLNGKVITMPKIDDAELAAQIKEKQAELKERQASKNTLDDLELTDNK